MHPQPVPSLPRTGQDRRGPQPVPSPAASALCFCRAGLNPVGKVWACLFSPTSAITVLGTCDGITRTHRRARAFLAGKPKVFASLPDAQGKSPQQGPSACSPPEEQGGNDQGQAVPATRTACRPRPVAPFCGPAPSATGPRLSVFGWAGARRLILRHVFPAARIGLPPGTDGGVPPVRNRGFRGIHLFQVRHGPGQGPRPACRRRSAVRHPPAASAAGGTKARPDSAVPTADRTLP